MKRKIPVLLIVIALLVIVGLLWTKKPFTENDTQKEEKFEEINLEAGLVLENLYNEEGIFVEDGSDELVENIATAVVRNDSDKTLQLVNIQMELDNGSYEFQLTTLQPGKSVAVQEKNRKSFPEEYEFIQIDLENTVYFEEEPSLYQNIFEIETSKNQIKITNISDQAIQGPIYVYYKNVEDARYYGGITYRVGFEGLQAGESRSSVAGHLHPESSEVMFVNYAL